MNDIPRMVEEDPEDAVVYLLADIRHFCDVHGLDLAKLDKEAYSLYYLPESQAKRDRKTRVWRSANGVDFDEGRRCAV